MKSNSIQNIKMITCKEEMVKNTVVITCMQKRAEIKSNTMLQW